MPVLFNRFSKRLAHSKTGNNKENIGLDTSLSMMSRHVCPCCSYVLLRHLSCGGIYWHCNHCYQAMPAFSANYSPELFKY